MNIQQPLISHIADQSTNNQY